MKRGVQTTHTWSEAIFSSSASILRIALEHLIFSLAKAMLGRATPYTCVLPEPVSMATMTFSLRLASSISSWYALAVILTASSDSSHSEDESL